MPDTRGLIPTDRDAVKGALDLRLGRRGGLQVTVGASAAGLASIGLLVSAILLSTAVLVRAAKSRH